MAQRLSVKQKILLSLWSTTLLLVVLTGTLASAWFIQDQNRRLDDFLTREVRGVQDTLQTFFLANARNEPQTAQVTDPLFRRFLSSYLQDRLNRLIPYKTTLGVFGPQGDLVQTSNVALSLVSEIPVGPKLTLTTVGGSTPYRLAVGPLEFRGQVVGTVRMACSTVTLAEVWTSFLLSMSMVLVPIFLSFGILGTLLIHWSLRPVREMSLSAHDISESHLDLRLTVPPGRDEIAVMAQTLNTLLARLERDYEFEEALVGQLSHELRTPLAILRGRNELALERLAGAPAGLQTVLEDNLADIDNLVSLLNTLLTLARYDGRIDPVKFSWCDLGSLLRELIEELEPLWEEKDLSFHLTLPGRVTAWSELPALGIRADSTLLRQVFLNILTNAYKYAPRKSRIHLTLDQGEGPTGPEWIVVFRNSGPRLPEESLDMVFKRFYRVEVQDPDHFERTSGLQQRGFGLGLSIAKTLVDLHRGTIQAYNPPSGGVAFEVRLPADPDHPRTHAQRSPS